MFKLDCFVEDRDLAYVMHALSGHVKDLNVVPVMNVEKVGGKIKAIGQGKLRDVVIHHLRKNKILELNTNRLKVILQTIGSKASNADYILRELRKSGDIRVKVPGGANKSTVYEVTQLGKEGSRP